MKKKNVIVLEWDDEPEPSSTTAYLQFHTASPGYILVDNLNRLYGLSLARIDDIDHNGTPWPLYTYHDSLRRLRYFLVETTPAENSEEKLLLLLGENAPNIAETIYNDLTHPASVQPGDLLAAEHQTLRQELLSDFTLVTRLDFSSTPSKPAARRRSAELQHRCEDILEYIERHRLDLGA